MHGLPATGTTGPGGTTTTTPLRRRARYAAAAFALTAIVGLSGLIALPAGAADPPPVTINLVTVNDFHGRIEQTPTPVVASSRMGIARLATAVNEIRAANPNTVFAAAGDLIGASTFTSFIQQDIPTIEGLNDAGLEVSAVGNHELDQGWDDLAVRVQNAANWEYVVANLKEAPGDVAIPEYWVTTKGGVRIGFVGAVTDELPSLVSPAGIAGVAIEAPVTAANRVANQLKDGNAANGEADIVVLLVHEGATTTALASATDPTSRFGQIVNGANANINAIVSGHTHLAYNHVINGRPVISSGQYGEKFSNMTIQVDPATKAILSMSNVVIDLQCTGCPNPAADPAIQAKVDAATATANVLGNVALGNTTADFNRAIQPTSTGTGENRGGESTLGNFVADVQLWSIRQDADADIAFMNPGGLRTDVKYAPDGVVTYKEAANVQPFANTLFSLTLTGAQVKAVLEQQWQPAGASRPFLKLGVNKELSYVFDPTAPAGQHITRIMLDGEDINPAGEYRVVANSFLAAGGDNFSTLAAGTNRADSGKVDLQSMVDWFAANGTATPDQVQRSVGVHLSAPDADGYDVGDALTIDLKSLDFSTNETPAGTVNVSLGGIALGAFPVDRSLVLAYDEIGRASVTTTIPAGLYGAKDLVVTVPATGTTATLPVALDKAVTTTTASLTKPKPKKKHGAEVQAGSTVHLEVQVDGPIPVDGIFTVFLDGAPVGDYEAADGQGRTDEVEVKLKLSKHLATGTHRIDVRYAGTGEFLPSETTVSFKVK